MRSYEMNDMAVSKGTTKAMTCDLFGSLVYSALEASASDRRVDAATRAEYTALMREQEQRWVAAAAKAEAAAAKAEAAAPAAAATKSTCAARNADSRAALDATAVTRLARDLAELIG